MSKADMARLVKEAYERWNGEGSWAKASNWRKADWRKMLLNFCAEMSTPPVNRPLLPSEIAPPPQPFRPYRADATDDNPED
jgi:hypothetical protein